MPGPAGSAAPRAGRGGRALSGAPVCPAPLLVLVGGAPGAGKTALAQGLGAALGLPVFTKDALKELMFERLGWSDRPWSRRVSLAAFDLLHHQARGLLQAGCSLLLEGNFDPAAEEARYRALTGEVPCRVAQVWLRCAPEVALERFRGRRRHPGHVDAASAAEVAASAAGRARPLDLPGPRLELDTSASFPDPAELARRLRAALAAEA